MAKTYQQLEQEYAEAQKEFNRAKNNKCAKCIDAAIKKMTRIDMEQAKILHRSLNSRPELQLNTR